MKKTYNFSLSFTKSGGEYLIFGLPKTNHYHQINDYKITPKPYKIFVDKEKESRGVIYRLNDVKETIEVEFNLQSHEIDETIPSDLNLSHYEHHMENSILPDQFINGGDKEVKSLAKKIIKDEKNLQKVIKKLYDFTLTYLTYGKPTTGLYTYRQAMEERITDCGGFSTLLASLLQSVKIPTRLVVGFLIKKNSFTNFRSMLHVTSYTLKDLSMHAWLEIFIPHSDWFPLDPSIEWRRAKGLTKRMGGFGYTPADRLVTSFGQNYTIKIDQKEYQIDLLQHPIYL